MASGKDMSLVSELRQYVGAQPVPQALPSVPPRTRIRCFHQRISKEESALVRGNSNAGFSHWGCRGPESGSVLPKVTQQGWNRELLALSLLLSPTQPAT